MSRLMVVADFLHSGQKWFQHWKGIPFIDTRFVPMLEWINFYGSEITPKYPLNITEFGPNGGKFTYTVLRQLQQMGMPQKVIYTIYGDGAEHILTQRDALQPFDKDCKYGRKARVRTHANTPDIDSPNLITELEFHKKECSDLKLAGENQQLILCLDSYTSYPKEFQERIFNFISNRLAYSGTLIFSVPTRSHTFHSERLRRRLDPLGSFIVDDMTYSGWTNASL